ncbi:MAG TPA: hypothetical protein PLM16_01615 [Candidatus Woesebacteria bacterium]|nr:hypothetical protein [Candidatus Woesebacteria bacterium]
MRDYFVQDRRDIPIRSQSVPRNSLQVAHLRQLGITDKYGIATRVLQLLKEGRYY